MITNQLNYSDHPSCLDLDSVYVKSYATSENLVKAMSKWEIQKVRYQIVRTPKGRWTALIIGFQQHLLGSGWVMIG